MRPLTTIGTGGQAFGNGATAFGTAASYAAYDTATPPDPISQALPFPFALANATKAPANLIAGQAWTFECWVRINAYANPPDDAYTTGYNSSDVTQILILAGLDGVYSFFVDVCYETVRLVNYANGQQVRAVGHNIPLLTWTHIGVTFDLNSPDAYQLKMYQNGLPTVQAFMGTGMLPVNGFSIGNIDSQTQTAALNGWLDEVRFWRYARTPQQMLAGYLKRTSALAADITAANMVACYSFEQAYTPGIEPAFLDGSGNGLHLQDRFHAWERQPVPSTVPFTS